MGHCTPRKWLSRELVSSHDCCDVLTQHNTTHNITLIRCHPFATAPSGLEIEPREYSILTKSRIKEVFEKHMGGSALDHRPYVAAASVLPMRTNNYVVSDVV